MSVIKLSDWKTDPLKQWPHLDEATILDSMGLIPGFLTSHEESAAAQFNAAYQRHGGWQSMTGWLMNDQGVIRYRPASPALRTNPGGDPPLYPAAQLEKLDGEIVRFYPGAWVSIREPSGDYEVAKLD